ncbi:hypothetical protein PLANPX_2300 [Lacipirellula parvula]|uniref:Uncharacterized protein n=1 Tax=Lacipirellula parvula TaxID=2650471 RepID=A0A5K7X7Z6_9BACT|nr:hypothetical protein PLANPX_2300 [Lacipirellula parvula]
MINRDPKIPGYAAARRTLGWKLERFQRSQSRVNDPPERHS